MDGLSIIIPACNEERVIGDCLGAIVASTHPFVPTGQESPQARREAAARVEIIVVPNGCTDRTADAARAFVDRAAQAGWSLRVIELKQGGKLNALNQAEAAASFGNRIYLDADVVVSREVVRELATVLARTEPVYASGTLDIAPPRSQVTRAYGRFWSKLPFVADGVSGCGLFAVNAAGRSRWDTFPDIISDDTFVRVQFSPAERIEVAPSYRWPLVEGFSNLVRVRRRQDIGVREIAAHYPHLMPNEGKSRLGMGRLLGLVLRDPVGFAVYAAVSLAVRLPAASKGPRWARGR